MFDVLTDVLERVRLAGTVYFNAELRAPWGVSVRPEGRAPFYVVTEGAACWKSRVSRRRARWPRVTSLCCLGRILTFSLRSGRCPPSRSVGS